MAFAGKATLDVLPYLANQYGGNALAALGAFAAPNVYDYFFGSKPASSQGLSRVPRIRKKAKRKPGYKRKKKTTKKKRNSRRMKRCTVPYRTISRMINKKKHQSTVQEWTDCSVGQITSAIGGSQFSQWVALNSTDVQAAVDKTLPTIDGSTVTYKDFVDNLNTMSFKTVGGYMKLLLRNNYNYPAHVELYTAMSIDHNSVSAKTMMENFADDTYTDSTGAVRASAEDLICVTLKNLARGVKGKYRLYNRKVMTIQPGQEKTYFVWFPKGYYSNQVNQNTGTTISHQKFFNVQIIGMHHGTLAHGTAADTQSANVSFSDSVLDYALTKVWRYVCNTTGEIHRREITETFGTVTNPEITRMDAEEVSDVVS